jgi:hypothetical protein
MLPPLRTLQAIAMPYLRTRLGALWTMSAGACRRECPPPSQPLARSARPGSRRHHRRRRGSSAYSVMDRACRARRHLAPAPRPVSRRPVRPPPAICPSALAHMDPSGSLTGPVTPLRVARRLLEQQFEELPVRLPQQERGRQLEQQCRVPGGLDALVLPEPAGSRTRRECPRAFRTGHDECVPGPRLDRAAR